MFCAFMLVHKFYLIAWLELDSNLFEFNRLQFEFEKEKGKENREAVQPAAQSTRGPPFFPHAAHFSLSLPRSAQLAWPSSSRTPFPSR
jgi:hypothetical protein